MNLQELKVKLESNGLGGFFDKLQPLLRHTIRLYQKETDENDIAIGQSKIGGRPDLPPGTGWITETNAIEMKERRFFLFNRKKQETVTRPLSFIAQINLSETAPFDKEQLLPKSGLLYFFYSAEQEVSGSDYKDKSGFKVIYWDGEAARLARTDFPVSLPDYARFRPASVQMRPETSFPAYGHEVYDDFNAEEDDQFWDGVYSDDNINKLLGHADNIQNPMELECELVTNGFSYDDPKTFTDPRAKALEANANNWRLLLQIDSNEENGMMWGDCGRLYFWIRKEDLLQKNFDKSWFSFQCT